jgi:hypothetical protein
VEAVVEALVGTPVTEVLALTTVSTLLVLDQVVAVAAALAALILVAVAHASLHHTEVAAVAVALVF